jgi:hypothetical protein
MLEKVCCVLLEGDTITTPWLVNVGGDIYIYSSHRDEKPDSKHIE